MHVERVPSSAENANGSIDAAAEELIQAVNDISRENSAQPEKAAMANQVWERLDAMNAPQLEEVQKQFSTMEKSSLSTQERLALIAVQHQLDKLIELKRTTA